ncbi:hypothetical protein [Dendronalium sp. ChiSLP03b]|uniref:hypothetical protein n=1 Tax=Dendronalium sp. ChiSLP03b TaxID=3075381 RepID=UPI002AD2F66A|nr:hypothetical protein [Dendronalium sp. ChiSLP03b]MDZ8205693.1 hypothetical protein [Dendronalium sp. ChiSLP03b]
MAVFLQHSLKHREILLLPKFDDRIQLRYGHQSQYRVQDRYVFADSSGDRK